jgi:hypothetical protein
VDLRDNAVSRETVVFGALPFLDGEHLEHLRAPIGEVRPDGSTSITRRRLEPAADWRSSRRVRRQSLRQLRAPRLDHRNELQADADVSVAFVQLRHSSA